MNGSVPWRYAASARSSSTTSGTSGVADADQSGLVQSAIARWEVIGVQDTETLDTVDRVVALQRVPMFAGIDPEDLERIATLHRTSL